jgi:hypothetical protein
MDPGVGSSFEKGGLLAIMSAVFESLRFRFICMGMDEVEAEAATKTSGALLLWTARDGEAILLRSCKLGPDFDPGDEANAG